MDNIVRNVSYGCNMTDKPASTVAVPTIAHMPSQIAAAAHHALDNRISNISYHTTLIDEGKGVWDVVMSGVDGKSAELNFPMLSDVTTKKADHSGKGVAVGRWGTRREDRCETDGRGADALRIIDANEQVALWGSSVRNGGPGHRGQRERGLVRCRVRGGARLGIAGPCL